MRLIGLASSVFALVLAFVISSSGQVPVAHERPGMTGDQNHQEDRRGRTKMARRSSATTRSVTSSCGRMCCACTNRLRR